MNRQRKRRTSASIRSGSGVLKSVLGQNVVKIVMVPAKSRDGVLNALMKMSVFALMKMSVLGRQILYRHDWQRVHGEK